MDGSLLCEIPFVASAVGTVLTNDELRRLTATPHLAGLQFYAASFDDLLHVPGKFDRIIVNSFLHFARTPHGAHRALKNIAALMAPRGKLWLGELLARDFRRKEFTSKLSAVRYVYRHYGPRFAFAFLRHLFRHRRRTGRIIEIAPHLWHIKPAEMPALAARYGLKVAGIWNCRDLTGDDFYSLQDRFSVQLSKE